MTDVATVRTVAGSRVRRRWRSLLLLGVMAGLVGGVVLGAVAGARRTSSAYDRLVERSSFPDAFVQLVEPRPGLPEEIAELPSVARRVDATFAVGLRRDTAMVAPIPVQTADEPIADFPMIDGRRPDPSRAEEVMVSPAFAEALQVGVGDVIAYQAMTDDDFAGLLRRGSARASGPEFDLRVVGIFRTPTDVVLEEFPTLLGTPALHRRLHGVSSSGGVWVHLEPEADVAELSRQIEAVAGTGDEERFNSFAITDFAAERASLDDATSVVTRGLLLAGAVIAVAGAVVLSQLVGRLAERERPDRRTLRQLGVSRRTNRIADAVWAWPLVGAAFLVAPFAALAVSGSMPLGVAGLVEPDPGMDVDAWVVVPGTVGFGLLLLALWTSVVGRAPSSRTHAGGRPAPTVGNGATSSLASWIALGASTRRSSRLIAVVAVGVAVAGTVGAVVFDASLRRLVESPEQWGWPGDLSIEATDEIREDLFAALDEAPEVAAYAEVRQTTVEVAGEPIAAYSFTARRGRPEPLVLRGRGPDGAGEIALGSRVLERLRVELGDVVATAEGTRRVVGEAATFGLSDAADHASGALVGSKVEEPEFVAAIVQVADGVDVEAFPSAVFPEAEYGSPVVPTEVSNLAELRPLLPLVFAALLAITAVGMIHLGLAAATRSRRDLAVLRAIGLSRSAGATVVVRAALLTAVVVVVFAVPVGAALGRRVWQLVAVGTDLAPDVAWPLDVPVGAFAVTVLTTASGAVAGRWVTRRMPSVELAAE